MVFFGIFEDVKKMKKRIILEQNKIKGQLAEIVTEMQLSMQGYEVKKVHKGKDFVAVRRDPFTGEIIEKKYIEVKTGPYARLSKAQKRSKARSKNYEVWHF